MSGHYDTFDTEPFLSDDRGIPYVNGLRLGTISNGRLEVDPVGTETTNDYYRWTNFVKELSPANGDKVWVLYGASNPFVLRREGLTFKVIAAVCKDRDYMLEDLGTLKQQRVVTSRVVREAVMFVLDDRAVVVVA